MPNGTDGPATRTPSLSSCPYVGPNGVPVTARFLAVQAPNARRMTTAMKTAAQRRPRKNRWPTTANPNATPAVLMNKQATANTVSKAVAEFDVMVSLSALIVTSSIVAMTQRNIASDIASGANSMMTALVQSSRYSIAAQSGLAYNWKMRYQSSSATAVKTMENALSGMNESPDSAVIGTANTG